LLNPISIASSLFPTLKMATSPRPILSVPNNELYNRWANVYDTDGNILQAIDETLLPALLSNAHKYLSTTTSSPITIIELGCGTGRNTVKLIDPRLLSVGNKVKEIYALDFSPGMLEVAKKRCSDLLLSSNPTTTTSNLNFLEFDALNPSSAPAVQELYGKADLVLSTLVLEHLPIEIFFSTLASFLKPSGGGYAVVTNMHAEMGRRGQAGFVDVETGIKVRGTSFNYEVEEVVEEGRKWGFELVGEMGEREVRESDLEVRILGERGRKWIGTKVWFGCVMRFVGKGEQ
jgi:SAM-dependent methyltransferase